MRNKQVFRREESKHSRRNVPVVLFVGIRESYYKMFGKTMLSKVPILFQTLINVFHTDELL